MRSLRELQEGFLRALISGVSERTVPDIRADGLSPLQRIGFYRTNVFGNYLEGLRATYQCVENLVGPGCFARHAEQFIRETPSRSGDLNRYGSEFADFLARAAISTELPYLAGVARLEWLLDEVFYAADHSALDLERLSQVAPGRARRAGARDHQEHPGSARQPDASGEQGRSGDLVRVSAAGGAAACRGSGAAANREPGMDRMT